MLSNKNLYTTNLQKLEELWLHVTFQCNLTCSHCLFQCSPISNKQELSLETAIAHVEEAIQLGLKKLYITGGESFLWSHMKPFLEWYYASHRIPLTILSNGTLIDDELARQLSTYQDQSLQLRISLECYLEDNNDNVRGAGSFHQAIKGIKKLNKHSVKPWIAFTNKTGSSSCCNQDLEQVFKDTLNNKHSISISGLKIISAYEKGRFTAQTRQNLNSENNAAFTPDLSSLQCCYGLAVCAEGIAPCPILVDLPDSLSQGRLADLIGNPVDISHSYCENCFNSGTTCGQ